MNFDTDFQCGLRFFDLAVCIIYSMHSVFVVSRCSFETVCLYTYIFKITLFVFLDTISISDSHVKLCDILIGLSLAKICFIQHFLHLFDLVSNKKCSALPRSNSTSWWFVCHVLVSLRSGVCAASSVNTVRTSHHIKQTLNLLNSPTPGLILHTHLRI